MAQILVRKIEESVKERIRKRARQHGRSMEEEARDILRSAVAVTKKPEGGLGTRIRKRFEGISLDEPIPELRGSPVKAAKFRL
ncbi:MAG TPA: Arc family DNA-binding protein [Rhizomicrobium sp.]|nr:Arc family DNA-binding protein [Rhizomicrobium sp.]